MVETTPSLLTTIIIITSKLPTCDEKHCLANQDLWMTRASCSQNMRTIVRIHSTDGEVNNDPFI